MARWLSVAVLPHVGVSTQTLGKDASHDASRRGRELQIDLKREHSLVRFWRIRGYHFIHEVTLCESELLLMISGIDTATPAIKACLAYHVR